MGRVTGLGPGVPVLEHGNGLDRSPTQEVGAAKLDPDGLRVPMSIASEPLLELGLLAGEAPSIGPSAAEFLLDLLEPT